MRTFGVAFSSKAEADLASIRAYLESARDPAFAESYVRKIITHCEGFAHFPHRGTRQDHALPGLRTVGWRKTITIGFRISETERVVTVLGVFYRGRNVLGILRKRGG